MKKPIILLLVMLLICILRSFAQTTPDLKTILMPSPDAASLGKFGTYPTTLYNGLVNIDIPIYTISLGELEIPVKLSYHASGIKLSDVAGNAGLGWTMNAGGVITRQINGISDERGLQYRDPYKTANEIDAMTTAARYAYLIQFVGTPCMPTAGHDSQSDEYNYSYPGGAGKFMFDVRTKTYFPVENPLLKVQDNDGSNYYTLTSEKGDRYYYTYGESTISYVAGINAGASANNQSAVTALYLTKIVAANNIDSVLFVYGNGEEILESDRQVSYNHNSPQAGPEGPPVREIQYIQSRTETGVLREIIAGHTKVEFEIARDRLDRRKIRYTAVKVRDTENRNIVREVKLNHSYFLGDHEAPNPNNARLRLDKVQVYDAGTNKSQDYTLSYNSLQLPNYFTIYDKAYGIMSMLNIPNYAKDYLGYYNGKIMNGSLLPNNIQLHVSMSGVPVGDRTTDPYFMQACMLTGITYPTGGNTQFEYEPNVVFNDFTPGLRIKRVRSYDSDGSIVSTLTYKYGQQENGYGRHTSLNFFSPQIFFTYNQHYQNDYFPNPASVNTVYNSFPNAPLGGVSGTPVFYDYVSEYIGQSDSNIGKNEYIYDFIADANKNIPSTIGLLFDQWSTIKNSFMYFDNSSQRGQLLELKQYENRAGNYILKKRSRNTYSTVNRRTRDVGNFIERNSISIGSPCVSTDLGKMYYYSDLVYETSSKLLIKTVNYSFEENGSVADSVMYTYSNPDHLRPTVIQKTDSKGNSVYTTYSYSGDFQNLTGNDDFSRGLRGLLQKNIRIFPVEESSYIRRQGADKLLSSYLTRYKASAPLTDRIYRIENPVQTAGFNKAISSGGSFLYDSRYKEYLKYDYADLSGKLVAQQKNEAVKMVYLWGYQYQYPVAEIRNATYDQVKTVLTQAAIDQLNAAGLSEAMMRDAIQTAMTILRSSLRSAQVTSYTYKPLVGMTSKTDATGQTEYYDYDGFGRLSAIRDHQDNIVKTFCYNYKGDPVDCNPSAPAGGIAVRLRSLTGNTNLSYAGVRHNETGQLISSGKFPDISSEETVLYIPPAELQSGKLSLEFNSLAYRPMFPDNRPAVNYQYQLGPVGPLWKISDGTSGNMGKFLSVPLIAGLFLPGQDYSITMDYELPPVVVPVSEFYPSSDFEHMSSNITLSGGRVTGSLSLRPITTPAVSPDGFVYAGFFTNDAYMPAGNRQFTSGNWLCEVRYGASPRLYIKWTGSGTAAWSAGGPVYLNINYNK